jgi:hypothetical protein
MELPRVVKSENFAPAMLQREALHELAVRYAEEQFARYGGCQSTWLIAAGMRVVWVETPLEDKDWLAARMRFVLGTIDAHAYSFITEAYVTSTLGMEDKELAKKILKQANKHGVRSLPEHLRDDVLMITSFDRDGGVSDSHWLVTVRRHGLNFLGPRVDRDPSEYDQTIGRLWNLLAPEKPWPEQL